MSSPEQNPLDQIEELSRKVLRTIGREHVLDAEPEPRIWRQDGTQLPLKHFVLESPHSVSIAQKLEAMNEHDPERAVLMSAAQNLLDTHMRNSLVDQGPN
jgi:hypothetical protein